ncbi:hypothetical protein [Nocardioides sp.]|uniref:hypothetical protein n=1 Tax=Nocardioides sp. TaxID=35761 RepID=UPI00356B1A78
MTPPADYCDLCELPLSMCVHGQPKRVATPASATPAKPRPKPAVTKAPAKKTWTRRTPQAEFRPHLLAILREHGGSSEVEDLMTELVVRMEGVLREADHETVNQGELRWRYAARLERKAMIDDGLMQPAQQPGIWQLTEQGLAAS